MLLQVQHCKRPKTPDVHSGKNLLKKEVVKVRLGYDWCAGEL